MTCIVGIESCGKVYIGGDLQGTSCNHKLSHTEPKVFSKNGIVFGFTDSYRFGQLIEHAVTIPTEPKRHFIRRLMSRQPDKSTTYQWLVNSLVPAIKSALQDNGFDEGGTCLIGVGSELWRMEGSFAVLRASHGYDSVGSGYEYALGALHSSLDVYDKEYLYGAEQLITTSIEAASKFCPSVGNEAHILST